MKKQIFIFELKQNETQILFTFFSDMAAYDNTAIFERKREIDENLFGQKFYFMM